MAEVFLDEPYVWFVTFGAFLMNCLTMGLLKSYTILMIEYQEILGSSASIGMLAGGLMVSNIAIMSPLSSFLCEKFTTRRMVFIGALATSLCLFGLSFVRIVQFYVLIFFLLGCCISLSYSPVLCMVSRCHRQRQALATGITMCGSSAGLLLLPPFLTLLLYYYPVQNCVLVLAGVYLNYAVTAALMPRRIIDPETRTCLFIEPVGRRAPSSGIPASGPGPAAGTNVRSCLSTWPRTKLIKFLVYVIATALANAGFVSQFTQYASYARESGLTQRGTALLLSIQGGLDGLCRICIGAILDRDFCPKWVYLVVALVAMGLNACLTSLWTGLVPCVLYSIIFAITGGVYMTNMFAVTRDIVGVRDLGRSFAVLLLFHGVTSIPIQYFIGFIRDVTENYTWSIRIAGILEGAAGLMIFLEHFIPSLFDKDCCLSNEQKQASRVADLELDPELEQLK